MSMMLIICNREPELAAKYLVYHTSKTFVLRQTYELARILCSYGFSDKYAATYQGKTLHSWVLENKNWILNYFNCLVSWCFTNLKLSQELKSIFTSILWNNQFDEGRYLRTAIFRYDKNYKHCILSDSELPIDLAIEEYQTYLTWKFNNEKENTKLKEAATA